MFKALCLFFLSFSLVSCVSDSSDTAKTINQQAEDFSPSEGTWHIGNFLFSNDGCNVQTWFNIEADTVWPFELAKAEEGFTLTNESDQVTSCTLTEMEYSCDADPLVVNHLENEPPLDLDAVTTTTNLIRGSFTDEGNGTGTFAISTSCEGPECDTLFTLAVMEDNPCTSDGTITVSLQ